MTALKTVLWSLFVPGTLTVVVPYLLLRPTGARLPAGWRLAGLLPLAVGAALYVWCAWDFTFKGRGTPAPFDPPKEVLVTGPYRFVRNPMYVAALLILCGEALLFASLTILAFPAALFVFFHAWVVFYEEPTLTRKFGASYEKYCVGAGRWVPRLRSGNRSGGQL